MVSGYGSIIYHAGRSNGRGVRPSVNLKSTIKISSGSGSLTEPYILEEDVREPINGTTLFSTRYSGEYLTFNNELYRIVATESISGEILTKITAVDKPNIFLNNAFHSVDGVTDFASADVESDLESYYQSLNDDIPNLIQKKQRLVFRNSWGF